MSFLRTGVKGSSQRRSVLLSYSDEMCRLPGKVRVLFFLVQLALLLSFAHAAAVFLHSP